MVCKYFLQPIGCLFILLLVPFAVEKLLICCNSIPLFSLLLPKLLVSHPKKKKKNHCQDQCQIFFPLMFSSRSFMVWGLILSLPSIFCCLLWVKRWDPLYFFAGGYPVFPNHLLKSLPFPCCIFLVPLLKIR